MGGVYGSTAIYGYPEENDLLSMVIEYKRVEVSDGRKVAKLSMDEFGDSRSNGCDLNTTQASRQTRFQAKIDYFACREATFFAVSK